LTPDWTIFRPLGDCLLRPLKKIKRVGYFWHRKKVLH
jgi:hypothetical protein